MPSIGLRPNHQPIRDYYKALDQYSLLSASHEGAVSEAFAALLRQVGKKVHWTLVSQFEIRRPKKHPLRVDGALLDPWSLVHGYWEAKDEDDDLAAEVKKKIADGYPTDNILFQQPKRALLYQDGKKVADADLMKPQDLVDVLKVFFSYQPPEYDQWERAVEEFKEKVPQLARALEDLIEKERKYPHFLDAFNKFAQVCRTSLNPQLTDDAVEKMLVQHVLTERIFRKVFNNPDFVRRNAIAIEIEFVVDRLTARSFDREKFLAGLDRFYRAIESTATTISDFTEKQHFLNTVYESFFQGYDSKTADTHGIVYTPQPIVRFIVNSVDEILREEFGRSLGGKGVHIIDPFVGTGNFILSVMRHIPKSRLPQKYASELHANEVMLLPYYIASMNIEHEYAELAGAYAPFEGLCLVDTFELAEPAQATLGVMTEKNTARVQAQKKAPIKVVVGNPPYNAWQVSENDGNKNRKYNVIDSRVATTYGADSAATLTSALSDPYVKAFRWGADRLGDEGVLAYVSNNSYAAQLAFDGMRKHLAQDFDQVYLLDLGGNVRKNPKLSGTTHNVFGIQVGVAIGLFVRKSQTAVGKKKATILYAKTGDDWRREQKYAFLDKAKDVKGIEWTRIAPDAKFNWFSEGLQAEFEGFMPWVVGIDSRSPQRGVFSVCSTGLKSQRDSVAWNFDRDALAHATREFASAYNIEVKRYQEARRPRDVDGFVDSKKIKWSQTLKRILMSGRQMTWDGVHIFHGSYRPFTREWVYVDDIVVDRLGKLRRFFAPSTRNVSITVTDRASRSPFACLIVDGPPELHLCATTDGFQTAALTCADEAGVGRDNVTDWALSQFRAHYDDKRVTKPAIFHYVYGLLHHPEYRNRFNEDLKRELPRIPFVTDFWGFARAGKKLAALHLGYEDAREFPLKRIEDPDVPLDLRVERMRLSKDKKSVVYNEFLTLAGVPAEALEYRLGNRSALEWIIDQYRVSTDARSGIVNDPNRMDDPEYIIRLIGKVVTVSLETNRIVKSLPPLDIVTANSKRHAGT